MLYGGSDLEAKKWWFTPNAIYDGKSPYEMTKTDEGLKKLDLIVKFSSNPLFLNADKKSCTHPTGSVQLSFNID